MNCPRWNTNTISNFFHHEHCILFDHICHSSNISFCSSFSRLLRWGLSFVSFTIFKFFMPPENWPFRDNRCPMYLTQFTTYLWNWNIQTNATFNVGPNFKVCFVFHFAYSMGWVYMAEPTWTFNYYWKIKWIRPKFHPIIENRSPWNYRSFRVLLTATQYGGPLVTQLNERPSYLGHTLQKYIFEHTQNMPCQFR